MLASKSSASSPAFKVAPVAGVALLLAAISFIAAWFVYARRYTLYYGDAEAHLNIARRVLDARVPSISQFGTVWLPLPHAVMLPFVANNRLWSSGLAGVFPFAVCFVIAGTAMFAGCRRVFRSDVAALSATLVFALNPNLLYLQAAPMTEALMMAGLLVMFWATVYYRDRPSAWVVIVAGLGSNVASLTRYEGWFLIPFVCWYFLLQERKWLSVLFGAVASIGPVGWLIYNHHFYNNALEFYNGPYSAMAIYKRQLAEGGAPYAGDHNWLLAIAYYTVAVILVVGLPSVILGVRGIFSSTREEFKWPLVLFSLSPIFYIWSMHSSGTPISIPILWPYGWYNTRYALTALPLMAFATGALVLTEPSARRLRSALAFGLVPLAFALAIALVPVVPVSICWKESEVNSRARRDWNHQAAQFLAANYRLGSGLMLPFGDLSGILREADIPLGEAEGNYPSPDEPTPNSEMLRREWSVAYAGDPLAQAVARANKQGAHFALRKQIAVEGAQVVEIYQRIP
jgi:Dolichyl-phosphate-mannose-protein mannosyltransferase